jgi:hypothetical protein
MQMVTGNDLLKLMNVFAHWISRFLPREGILQQDIGIFAIEGAHHGFFPIIPSFLLRFSNNNIETFLPT